MADPLDTNVKGADPRNYGIAKRASLWVRPFGSTDDADWDEIGNLADLSAVPDLSVLEHKSIRRGALTRDRIEYTERKLTLEVKLDEVKTSNLMRAFGSSLGKEVGTATVREGRVEVNPGAGELVDLEMTGLASLIVRSANEEGSTVTYEADDFSTDSTDNTAGGTFNNTTDPITIVAATYPGTTFVVGTLIKIENEILRATAVGGGNVTLSRGALSTTPAAHANGVDIFKNNAKDYILDDTAGMIYILPDGDLADESTVVEFHVYFSKEVATETFEMFDGTPVKLEAEYQVLTAGGARIVMTIPACIITNKGAISFGLGDKWIEMPLVLEALANEQGKVGYFHVINAAETL